ncbi:immunoglobulin-like domain-containing protein, partial [Halomonas shengliensis]|uniref:immunoglobulin-like domain-containing protein n=1 Tax=Halomonas shengliensis TaxID=419597 RepID=UPI00115FC190
DTTDTTTVTLDDVTVNEAQQLVYTASVDNAPQGAFSVTLNNGVVINFADGALTGSSEPQPAQGEDVYLDADSFPISIASTSGGNYEALDTTDTATVTITDTINDSFVTLTGSEATQGGTVATVTATVDNAPESDLTLNLVDDNGDVIMKDGVPVTIIIQAESTEGTADVPVSIGQSYEIKVGSYDGGNYENLVHEGTANVGSPPNILNLDIITNTNVNTQYIQILFTQGENSYTRVLALDAQGQGASLALDVGFDIDPSQPYTINVLYMGNEESVSDKVIITDFVVEGTSISDSGGIKLGTGNNYDAFFEVEVQPGDTSIVLNDADYGDRDGLEQYGDKNGNNLTGSSGDDLLGGGGGDDILAGGLGNDALSGGEGNDTLYGDEGDDFLAGGSGNDTLTGGSGNDTMIGGLGADTFVWNLGDQSSPSVPAEDTVTDFGDGDDVLDISDLLQGEELESNAITDYIVAKEGEGADDGNLLLYIKHDGGDGAIDSDGANADQVIKLEGKGFDSWNDPDTDAPFNNGEDLIQHLIETGQINIDQ